MDYAKKLKTAISCRVSAKRRYITVSSREEEGMDAHTCPCGTTTERVELT